MDIQTLISNIQEAITLAKANPSDPAVKEQLAALWDICQEFQVAYETFVGL